MMKIDTVIGINSVLSNSYEKRKKQMDYREELQEIIAMVDRAKNRLGDVSIAMDSDDLDTAAVDEALDALDDVIDILEDAVEDE